MPTKVHLVKAMVFSVVMYGCESWTIKKTEHRRIDAFELWCWRLLRVPWTERGPNQSILKEISPECSFEGLIWSWNSNTLATWCEELTHRKRPWCWEGLRTGGEGDNRGWDGWMASLTQWTWVWVTPGVGDGQGGLACCSSWGHKESDMTEQLNWTDSLLWELCVIITGPPGKFFTFFFLLNSSPCFPFYHVWHPYKVPIFVPRLPWKSFLNIFGL